jgi:chemotaxis protein methyltransferase CheR
MPTMQNPPDIEDIELRLLMQGIHEVYGHDFSLYAQASLARRFRHWLSASEFDPFSQAQSAILRDRAVFTSLLQGVTVNVTEMFRDPDFFRALREQVVPHLKTHPFVNIWLAGCATGEEVYSTAILLNEAGMRGRYHLFATDLNAAVLERARQGIYPLRLMQSYTRSYQQSGGMESFADYYTARYEHAILMDALKQDLSFLVHNLATDKPMDGMHLILCRNVMIYFKQELKEHCIRLFQQSLLSGGFLCLGAKEVLGAHHLQGRFAPAVPRQSIYQKCYA